MRQMKKWISLVLLVTVLVTVTGCGSTSQAPTSKQTSAETVEPASPTMQELGSTVVDNRKNKATASESFSDADFTKQEYLFENSIGDSLYFVVVTNNSEAIVSVSGNATAKDAAGNPIGADNMSIDVLGPGETSIGYFYFDSVKNIASVDYQLAYSPSKYYKPVIGNLAVQQILNDKNVTITVTNEGDINAQFVQAHALFFDAAGNVIAHSSGYVTDNDSEIKPGATLSAQLDIYGQVYDHAEVYFTGRSDGKSTPVAESKVSDADFEIVEKPFTNSIGDSMWYLIVTNNSEYDVGFSANGTAYDAGGNIIGADDTSIDVVGAGQTSICYFYFDSVPEIDHVEYTRSYNTDLRYYSDVIHDLSSQITINDQNVIVSVTNTGSEEAEFVQAYALFIDGQGNIIAQDSTYVTDDDSEIKPGATITKQLNVYGKAFDTVEVYFTGRRSS